MELLGYFDVFPAKTGTELRTASFESRHADDPLAGGTFLFTEYFCTDPQCDCQRVLVKVLRVESEDARPEEVATISYSWNPNSDEVWAILNSEIPNPFLDPFHRQASYACELLEFWNAMVERDEVYASRLQRHYHEIRAEVGQTAGKQTAGKWSQPQSANQTAFGRLGRPHSKRNRKLRKRRLTSVRKRK